MLERPVTIDEQLPPRAWDFSLVALRSLLQATPEQRAARRPLLERVTELRLREDHKAEVLEMAQPIRDADGDLVTDADRAAALQARRYARLRHDALGGQHGALYRFDWKPVEALLEAERFEEVTTVLEEAMPLIFLTPRTHQWCGFAYHKMEDRRALGCLRLAELTRAWMLGTGDGSLERPIAVGCVVEEYDFLRRFGREKQQQRTLRRGVRVIDRLECTDGSALHFDITEGFHAAWS